ncbi:MAG: hypothetical protein LBS74_03750 [Oscillospiraceae bacterium]|nr:hypothetical protein [Oscillospiraceae bacterium]
MAKFTRKYGGKVLAAILVVVMVLSVVSLLVGLSASAVSSTPLPTHLTIGYWLGGNGGSKKTLAQVHDNWDVINVSFIETSGNNYTPTLNMDLSSVYSGDAAAQKAAFIADIATVHAKGKKVVISVGGQNGVVHLDNASQRDTFLNGVKGFINEYGFDGFDVDFEGSSITAMGNDTIGNLTTQQAINTAYVLRNLKTTYGSNFIISAAPEYCYVQGGAIAGGSQGAFLPLLDNVRDILTYIHPQYYNGFDGDFAWLEESANAGAPFAHVYSKDGYVRLSEMLITGFVTKARGTFVGLRPDQVVFGVPARSGAGNGVSTPADYAAAFNQLVAEYPTFRGVMTWSIGWDETGSNTFATTVGGAVKTANGNAPTPTLSVSVSANKSGTIDAGTAITWTATSSNGTGTVRYRFDLYKDTQLLVSGTLGTSATYSYTPTAAGSYYVKVTAQDSSKSAEAQSTAINVTVPAISAGITADKTGAIQLGASIRYTATASGGTGALTYKFDVYRNGSILVTGTAGSATVYNYTPTTAGSYTVKLTVKDSQNNSVTRDSAAITVEEQLNIPTVSKTGGSTVGSNITVKGTASGGVGTKSYSIYVLKNGVIVSKIAYSTTDSITFVPSEAGSYKVRVYVQDDNKTRVAKELSVSVA